MYVMWEVCIYSQGFLHFADPFSAKIEAESCNDAARIKCISKTSILFLGLLELTILPPLHVKLRLLLPVH